MDLEKRYADSDGNKLNILQMVKREPEWAATRIQEGEKAIFSLEYLSGLVSRLNDNDKISPDGVYALKKIFERETQNCTQTAPTPKEKAWFYCTHKLITNQLLYQLSYVGFLLKNLVS